MESHEAWFYFTHPAPGGPDGWSKCWQDLRAGVPLNETALVLGGEMSMWSDTYCNEHQCGAKAGSTPCVCKTSNPSTVTRLVMPNSDLITPASASQDAIDSLIDRVGAALFSPSRDTEFAKSIGGMIWPRGFVGAQAFWNYNASVDPSSEEFVQSVWILNDDLTARGSLTCPTKCSCDQLSACGKPYIAPSIGSAPHSSPFGPEVELDHGVTAVN